MRIPVYILYAQGHRYRGSVIMRGMQLAALGAQYLQPRFSFETLALPRKDTGSQLPYVMGLRGGIVILQKAAATHIDEEAVAFLKARNIALLVDWIDKKPKSPHMEQFDMHLAASYAQLADLRARLPNAEVRHLTHHADPRLSPHRATGFRTLYLGHASNVTAPEGIDVTVADVRSEDDFLNQFGLIHQHSMHYGVRDEERHDGVFKPFTKGFTAAACEANILVQRDADDAEHYLGADYPFFVEGTDPGAIAQGYAFARDSYGGPEWHRGLAAMERVHERTCPRSVARELGGLLSEIVGRRAPRQVAPRRSA